MTNTFISFGKDIKNPQALEDVPLNYIVEQISQNTGLKNLVSKIRNEKDKKERTKLKIKLPYVLWSGTFWYRSKDKLKDSSGLACLDFDDYEIAPALFNRLKNDPYVFIMFHSPSGGIKVIIKIPKVKDDIEFKLYYNALLERYNDAEADISTKDICRACFLSHDPEIYVNESSLKFEETDEEFNEVVQKSETIEENKLIQEDIKGINELPKKVAGISTEQLKEILDHLPAHSYSHWIKVGLTLRGASNELFPLFDEWSKGSSSYEGTEDCLNKWNSFKYSTNPYGFLPLIKMAKEFGYKESSEKVEQKASESALLVKNMMDYDKLEKNNNFIVDGFLYPETVNMLYSPPGHFKSIMSLYLAMCIATGTDFYKYKTKQHSVLYFDGENSDQILKERLEKLRKGFGIDINLESPLYFAKNGILFDSKKNINHEFVDELYNFCEVNNIKVIIFDTLHRFAYYDENSSDDVNMLYTMVFKPLQEKGISVLFLHHSTKQGDYRGTGDFLGMVDCCYNVKRRKGTDNFVLENQKSRNGEIQNIYGNIYFEEDEWCFSFKDEAPSKDTGKLGQITEKIELIIKEGKPMKRKDIMERLDSEKIEYNSKTVNRALKFLVEEKATINKDDKKVYTSAGNF